MVLVASICPRCIRHLSCLASAPCLRHPGLQYPTPAPTLKHRTARPYRDGPLLPCNSDRVSESGIIPPGVGPLVRTPPPDTAGFLLSLFRKHNVALVCRIAAQISRIRSLKKGLFQQDSKLGVIIDGSIYLLVKCLSVGTP